MNNNVKIAIGIVILILMGGLIFKVLFKIGLLALLALAIIYLYKKVSGSGE